MALRDDGSVIAWGDNRERQTHVPVETRSGVVAVAAGSENNLALREDGRVAAWGSNRYAPDGGLNNVPRGALSGVAAIAAGNQHGMALKNGGVIEWDEGGETTVPAAAQSGVKAIAAGEDHSMAVKAADGSVVAWGDNDYGQTIVPTGLSGVKAIAGGYLHSMALKEDGSVVAWGSGSLGQTTVPAAAQSGVKAIDAGRYHSMALRDDGSVVAWGYNAYGQTTVPAAAQSGVVAIAAGNHHSLAVKDDGTVVAWGYRDYGQITVPGGLSGVVAVAGGSLHSLAIVDNTPPAPVDNFAADNTVGDGRVSLSWNNPSTSDFQAVRVLRSTSGPATSPAPNADQTQVYEGAAQSFTDTGLTGATTYYYTIYARDKFGNFSVKKTATATPNDAIAPNTTITGGPSGAVNSASATFTFTSSENGSTFECRLDGAGAFTSCASGIAHTNLSDGSHTFEVRAKDATGNIDATPESRTWSVDTAVPDTALTSGPTGSVHSSTATFDFNSPEDGATFECKLDSGAFAACQTGKTYQNLPDGSHTFSVRAKDAAGNIDATPESRTWTVDVTAPNTTITSGPTGSVKSTSATFGFSSEAGASFECKLDGGAFAACQTGKTYENLSDGSHTFSVRATDAAGNTDATPESRTWSVDTAVPDTALTSGPTGSVKSTSATFGSPPRRPAPPSSAS